MRVKAFALFTLMVWSTLNTSSVSAEVVTKSVIYTHEGVTLEGYLAYDEEKIEDGKLPAILVVPEWWGLNDYVKGRAKQLAEMGYVAFALDMYGKGVVTEDAKKAGELAKPFYGTPLMAARARAGLDQLLGLPFVDKNKVAAIGFCFGGSTVQALAYTDTPLLGVVSFHGGPVPAPADITGKVKTKFLFLNGAIDPLVKTSDRDALEKSLEVAKIDYQWIDYAGALHAFSNPGATKLAEANSMAAAVGYNPVAAKRSWQHMRLFLSELFSESHE